MEQADFRYIPRRFPPPAAYYAGGMMFPAVWPTSHPHDIMMISSHYADSTYRHHSHGYHAGMIYGHDQYGRRNIPPPLPLPALGRSDLFDFVDDSAILRQDHRYRNQLLPGLRRSDHFDFIDDSAILRQDHRYRNQQLPGLRRSDHFDFVDDSAILRQDLRYRAPFHHHYGFQNYSANGLYNPAPQRQRVRDRDRDRDHWENEEAVLILVGLSNYINENNHGEEDIDHQLLQLGIIRSTADDSNNNPMNNQNRDGIEDAVTRFLDARRVCDGAGDSEICVICQEDLAPSSEGEDETAAAVVLDCAHRFHSNCIKQWLITPKNICPLCRAPISIPTNS